MTELTSVTAIPLAAICFAVEPVETISTPASDKALANSISPVLSETEISALFTAIISPPQKASACPQLYLERPQPAGSFQPL